MHTAARPPTREQVEGVIVQTAMETAAARVFARVGVCVCVLIIELPGPYIPGQRFALIAPSLL